jgi:murein DD-endopeptidase MepM/ murein hydrolase activator NlpD
MIHRIIIKILVAGILLLLASSILGQDANQDNPQATIHVVQQGETLFRIAQEYSLTIEEIATINSIDDTSNIQVGQRLIIPIPVPEPPPEPIFHEVQAGETLYSIAEHYNTSPETLAVINNFATTDYIFAGQLILINDVDSTSFSGTSEGIDVVHVVKSGESLFLIALQYDSTTQAIQDANELEDVTLIFAGQEIIVPSVQAPQNLNLPNPVTGVHIKPVFLFEGGSGSIQITTNAAATVTGTFLNRTLNVVSENNNTRHTTLVAIPIYTDAGIYAISLVITPIGGQPNVFDAYVRILAGGHETENITLPDDRLDLLNPAMEDYELGLLQNLTSSFNPELRLNGQMILPVTAIMSGAFGTRRSYNDGPVTRYHNGTDFAAVPGTQILAPAPGQVVLADTLNVRGISVVLDHGWGIYTNYSHMTERYVSLGEFVTTGQSLGTVGNTGRTTGAHLHWELWLNGIAVDPMQWVEQSFP